MFIPNRLVNRILLCVYGVFIVLGLAMLVYGIYLTSTTAYDVSKSDGLELSGVTAIVAIALDIAIGCFGLFGILYKKRVLLFIIIFLLGGTIITNIAVLIITVVTTNNLATSAKQNIRNQIVKQYGNHSDPTAKYFTLDIDYHQRKAGCCGFSGDESENLFVKSPWFNVSNHGIEGTKKHYLPDVCCLGVGAECRYMENLKEARDKKLVYPDDCYSKIRNAAEVYMWMVIIQMSFMSLLQGMCIGLNVMSILLPEQE